MKNIKYWLFVMAGFLILLMLYAKFFYYTQRYNELIVIEDLLSGKKIKCNEIIYQLDKEHFLTMFPDEIGRNERTMTIMKKNSDTSASGNPLYRCSSIDENTSRDIKVSIIE